MSYDFLDHKMNFVSEPLLPCKRQREETSQGEKEFIELTDEELLASFANDNEFVDLLRQKQQEAKEKFLSSEDSPETVEEQKSTTGSIPAWKDELQRKLAEAKTVEDLDVLTREIVKKNKAPKLPKKKLMRVENFYQRHIQGLQWMTTFLQRTKMTACSRPFVERMLELENQFKKQIENDDLLGPHLEKD